MVEGTDGIPMTLVIVRNPRSPEFVWAAFTAEPAGLGTQELWIKCASDEEAMSDRVRAAAQAAFKSAANALRAGW